MATNSISFTEKRIAEIPFTKGEQIFYRDQNTDGLGLRVGKTAKAYYFESKLNRKTIRHTIGNASSWRLIDAQKQAREFKTQIDKGIDIRFAKEEQKESNEAKHAELKAGKATLLSFWDEYIEHKRIATNKRTGKRGISVSHEREIKNMAKPKSPLYQLLALPIGEVNQETFTQWLKSEAKRNHDLYLSLAFRLFGGFATWFNDTQPYALDLSFIRKKTIKDLIPKIDNEARKDDLLTIEQLPQWFNEVRQLSPIMSSYLQILLLTGARREEVAQIKWSDINFRWKTIKIKDKIKGQRTIGLTPYVESLISALPKKGEYVFYSATAESGKLQEPSKAHKRALKAADIPHIRLHGLRRTFITMTAQMDNVNTGIIMQLTGHRPTDTHEKNYTNRPMNIITQKQTEIETFILKAAGIEFNAEAKPFQKVRAG